MYRVRFHGRGGQGMKTASRILGTAFFLEGFEVQDAPRYGAERRGAPVSAYVRADGKPINERGVIARPDLVVVADDTLIGIPAAAIMDGVDGHCILLIVGHGSQAVWRERLQTAARIVTLAPVNMADRAEHHYPGATCAGAAAGLLGVISKDALRRALAEELAAFGEAAVGDNISRAQDAFDAVGDARGIVSQRPAPAVDAGPPDWIDLARETAGISAPAIHAAATSVQVRTGLWRTLRPVIDKTLCKKCVWVCGSFCPDGVISTGKGGYPVIDYDHCKGCLVCLVQCPAHAIEATAEHTAAAVAAGGGS